MLLIPGPVSCSSNVIKTLGSDSLSHTGGEFTAVFHNVLKQLRVLFHSDITSGSLPVVISGSGTLGFDIVANNLFPPGKDKILLLSTGYFSDEFGECLQEFYGYDVTVLKSDSIGESINLNKLQDQLLKEKYDAVVMTHVDTSTGVLNDLQSISGIIHEKSPQSLIVVDAVCSLGCEEILFDDWKLDFVLSASQKAICGPSGLSVSMISGRALQVALNNDQPRQNFYTSLKKWAPCLQSYESGKLPVKYFATPPTQLIGALNVALIELLNHDYVRDHRARSNWFKKELVESLGLKLVSKGPVETTAHGLTAVYVSDPMRVVSILAEQGITIAGGLHPEIKSQYVRVGLMGMSAIGNSDSNNTHSSLSRVLAVLEKTESAARQQAESK